MKASYLTKENKITVYTSPEYRGADIPDEYMKRTKDIDVPVTSLYGLEPDDKMRAKEHADTMLALALKMRKGWTPDPIIVVKTSKGYMILDGHHRFHAAKKAGVETLPAVVVDKGDLKYTDEIPEGKLAKAVGAAAIAGCIAGTPGCAVTSVKDVARDIQTVGRTAQTVKDMGRAGAEEELYNILRQKLRNVKEGNVEEDSIYQALKRKLGVVSHKADYDKVASVLHSELVKASRGGEPQHGLGYYAQQLAKQFDGIDYRALIDVYKNTYGTEGLTESLDQPYELAPTSYLYSSGKWDVKAYSDTHVMIFRASRMAGETAGPGAHWAFEFGTKPIVSHGMYSMDKTGEGDSQRVFATAIAAIKEFVSEVEPGKVTFTAEKGDAGTSRTRLYQRLVKTYAPQLGFKASREAGDSEDTFTLVREAEMTKHEMGFGMHQYTNDSFALVGGARSGSSNPGEVRLRYDVYSWELADALGDPNKAKIGFVELRVSEEDGDILGLINIELDPEHRSKGYGRRVVKDIVDTTKTGRLDIHDIQKDARAFWQSFGGKMRRGATGDETTITRENDKMGKIDVGSSIQNAREEWKAWIQSLPTQLAQEFIDERPNPDQEDIDVFTKLRLTSKTPINVSTKALLKQPWMKGSISRTPQPVVDAINKRYGTNFKSGTVYDRNPDRFFKYAKMTANTAKPSVMVDGDVIFGVGRMIAALLRGDETIPVWNLKTVATESASGYIPTAKEKRDPRFKTALTVDVKPGETQRQAAKLGMKIDKAGNPPLLHKTAAKNTTPNKAYNLGLTESLWNKYQALKEGVLEEEELVEISQTPGAIRDWASSEAAQGVIAGFEAEVILPGIGSMEDDEDEEPDFGEDRRAGSIEDVIDFFSFDEHGFGLYGREARDLQKTLEEEYQEWVEDQIMEAWDPDEFERILRDEGWYEDMLQDELDDLADNDEIDEEDKQEEAEDRVQDRIDRMWSGDSGFYGDALDVFRQEKYDNSDLDEQEFFEENYPFMSDISDRYGISWPYIVGNASDPNAWENLGQDLEDTLGKPVRVSSGYHSMGRGNYYIMEPDSSISPDSSDDAGVEIVSPPMPLAETQSQLSELISWLKSNRAYTNESTGLHMGISMPDVGNVIDYVKMVLFTGDRYMLEQFDRAYNSYARSAMEKLETRVKQSKDKSYNFDKINIVDIMNKLREGQNTIAAAMLQGRIGSDKYTSIHVKRDYIEFRIAGGDYLNKAEEAELAMLRFARAYTIAADPNAEREEYQKKLYKLADTENPIENIWAQYQAGTINSEQLKDAWANRVLGIDPEAGKEDAFGERIYQVREKTTGRVVKNLFARDDEEAQSTFQNYLRNYPEEQHKDYVLVDPTKASKDVQGRKADVAKRLQQRTRIFKFELTKPDTDQVRARGAALEGVRQALREQETQTFLVPAQDEQSARQKLPYYADWITPRSAGRAKVAQILPAKAENMPQEPDYVNKDFAFQFNLRGETGAGATQTVKISAPNRSSAVEELANKVRTTYGATARVENLKQVDPARVKDGELRDEPQEQTYRVEVKIQTGDQVDYKILDVKAENEYLALNKAEEPYKRNNPNSIVSAKIADQSQ